MQEKNTLINSMNNLINHSHISISRKNQQQMFASLTRKDFDKIISNLQDNLLKLRITTAKLLTQLLYNNLNLKIKFCQIMEIQVYPNSNIVLNSNLLKIMQKWPKKQKQLFSFLKRLSFNESNINNTKIKQPLLWYINPKNEKLEIEYLQRQELIMVGNFGKNISFDPLDCIFGVILTCRQNDVSSDSKVPINNPISNHLNNYKDIPSKINSEKHQNPPPKQRYQVQYMPMSTKNNGFVKQSNIKTGNYSFSGPPQVKKYVQYRKNQEIVANSPTGTSQTFNSYIQSQDRSNASKKQNQDIDQFGNRLSLQFHDFKASKKVNTFQTSSHGNKSDLDRREATTPIAQHHYPSHHGIKLMTPRQSIKNTQKLSISYNGAQTERANTQKEIMTQRYGKEKINEFIDATLNSQRLKTIHLGKGIRESETAREKKSLRIQRH